jgi:tetratricopeptide (TPR) repeat protein
MAFLAVEDQRIEDAIRYWEETLRYAEQSSVVHTIAHAHTMLSRQYLNLGDLAKVKAHMRQVLLVHQHYAHDWQTLGAMYGAYGRHYLLARGDYEQAAIVFAFVAHHPMALGYIRTDAEKFLAETRPHLPPDLFEKACAKGKQITLRELLRDALTALS